MKLIALTQGEYAIVDTADYEWLNQWKWCVVKGRNTFYAQRGQWINGKARNFLMHRVILGLVRGDRKQADHRNYNGLDNRRENLRRCTRAENLRNQRAQIGTTSRYKGVYWNKRSKRWYARIQHNHELLYLGCFKHEADAARAYDNKAMELFGEFASLNFGK